VGVATQIIGNVLGAKMEEGGKIMRTMKTNESTHERSASKIRKAALMAISQSGIDRVTVSQICGFAKKTRPTFYAYFDSIDGLLADIWLVEGFDFLERLVSADYEVMNTEFSVKDRALLEILAISHRSAEVSESVNPLLMSWWNNLTRTDEFKCLKYSWLLAERLGAMLMVPLDPESKTIEYADELLLSLERLGKATSDDLLDLGPMNPNPTTPDLMLQSQSLDDVLIRATVEVVSKSGIKAASMSRVARLAQVSTGSVYPRYPNIEELVIATFSSTARQIVTDKLGELPGSPGPGLLGLIVSETLNPELQKSRNFSLEVHLEGRINKKISENFQANNAEIHEKLKAALTNLVPSDLAAEVLTNLIRGLGLGFALLLNAGIPVNELDHRPISSQIVLEARKIGQKPSN
jgi:AcrR family transcriptional regulator